MMEPEKPALSSTQPLTKFAFVISNEADLDIASRKFAAAHAARWSRAQEREARDQKTGGQARLRRPSRPTPSKKHRDHDPRNSGVLTHQLSVARKRDLNLISPSFDLVGHMPQLFDDTRGYSALAGLQGHVRRVFTTMRMRDANADGGDPTVFAADLLSACVQHSTMTRTIMPVELLGLKAHVIEQVQRDIESPEATSVCTINAIMALGTWVVSLEKEVYRPASTTEGDRSVSMAETPKNQAVTAMAYNLPHRGVILALIARRGGPRTMLDSAIARTTLTFLILTDAIMIMCGLPITAAFLEADLSPSLPQCAAMTRVPAMWYSPFFCPKDLETTLPLGHSPISNLLSKVVVLVHRWLTCLDLPIGESDEKTKKARAMLQLTVYGTESRAESSETGYRYEACRLTALLLLCAETQGCSLRAAARGTRIMQDMETVLKKTDLYGLWGTQIGILYWILLTSCAAAPVGWLFRGAANFFTERLSAAISDHDCSIAVGLRPVDKVVWFEKMCLGKRMPESKDV